MNHPLKPIYNAHSQVLILGSFPSVASRQESFYYAHPRNRFWHVIAALMGEEVPQSREDKKALLLAHHIALWDVVQRCDIVGSSDSTIQNVVPMDLSALLKTSQIKRIYANGATAFRLYETHCKHVTHLPITKLPSTSPANAACSLEKLIAAWSVIKG